MKTTIELPENMQFYFRRKVYKIDPWDLNCNPYLLFWARAQSEPVTLIRDLLEAAEDPDLKEELKICLERPADLVASSIYGIVLRQVAISRYGFAVPDKTALDLIQEHSPGGVVEIGAGSGYWAMLLRRLGVPVAAYDSRSGEYRNAFKFGIHSEVAAATHDRALADGAHREKTLLLAWPDYDEAWPNETLEKYKGDTVVYVGEWGGCTGDEKFHETLEREWKTVKEYQVPVWWSIHDSLYVLKRVVGD